MSAAVYTTGEDTELPVALHLVVTADGDRIVAAGANPVSWTSLRLLSPVPVTHMISAAAQSGEALAAADTTRSPR